MASVTLLAAQQYWLLAGTKLYCLQKKEHVWTICITMNGQESNLLSYDPSTSTKPKRNTCRTNNTIL